MKRRNPQKLIVVWNGNRQAVIDFPSVRQDSAWKQVFSGIVNDLTNHISYLFSFLSQSPNCWISITSVDCLFDVHAIFSSGQDHLSIRQAVIAALSPAISYVLGSINTIPVELWSFDFRVLLEQPKSQRIFPVYSLSSRNRKD